MHVYLRQALKDARKVVPTTMAMSSPPLPVGSSSSALAVARGPSGGDGSIVSRALLPPGGGGVAAGRGVAEAAAAAAEEGRNGDALSYVEKLELRAEEIMERVLGLAAFCERAGASKELDVSVGSWEVRGGDRQGVDEVRRHRLFFVCSGKGQRAIFLIFFHFVTHHDTTKVSGGTLSRGVWRSC